MNFGVSLNEIDDVMQQNYIFVQKLSADYVHMQAEWVKMGSVMGDIAVLAKGVSRVTRFEKVFIETENPCAPLRTGFSQ